MRAWASAGRARPRSPSRCSCWAATCVTTPSTTARRTCGTQQPGRSARPCSRTCAPCSAAPGRGKGTRRSGGPSRSAPGSSRTPASCPSSTAPRTTRTPGRLGTDDLKGGEGRVRCVGDAAAVGEHFPQRVQRLGGDQLAGSEHRDAGRIRRDQLRADPAHRAGGADGLVRREERLPRRQHRLRHDGPGRGGHRDPRSEEHTSELQSRPHLVCRLLLEKKKKKIYKIKIKKKKKKKHKKKNKIKTN